MRKLILLLIAFIAMVTFIRAYDSSDIWVPNEVTQTPVVEARITN